MKRYIKVNANNEIIDLFFEVWKDRFDGTEIYLDDKDFGDCQINGKYISNENGVPIFQYLNLAPVEKSQLIIDTDPKEKAAKINKCQQELSALDTGMIRVYEDIMDVIIAKNIIKKDDLPLDAHGKIDEKKAKRAELQALIDG